MTERRIASWAGTGSVERMIPRFPALLFTAVVSMVPVLGLAGIAEERAEAAWGLARGCRADGSEIAASAGGSVAEILAAQRAILQGNAEAQQRTAKRAWRDAFGDTRPFEKAAGGEAVTYTELLSGHLEWLGAHPEAYRAVIDRAYQQTIGRAAFDLEFTYWLERPVHSSAVVVACIDNWARRNQPGLMATTGQTCIAVSSTALTTIRLTPAVAAEARAAMGATARQNEPLALARGENVVAPGADGVISVSGVYFIALGAEATGTCE